MQTYQKAFDLCQLTLAQAITEVYSVKAVKICHEKKRNSHMTTLKSLLSLGVCYPYAAKRT